LPVNKKDCLMTVFFIMLTCFFHGSSPATRTSAVGSYLLYY
jgi:hypothetical protein